MRERMLRSLRSPLSLFYPAFILMLFVVIVPLVFCVGLSFCVWNLATLKPLEFNYGLNYLWLVQDERFLASLKNLIYYLGVGVSIQLLGGLLISTFIFNAFKSARYRTIVLSIILTPMLMAPVASGFTWWMMDHYTYGTINYFLGLLGLPAIEWLADPRFALTSVMIAEIWQWTPFMTLILYAGRLSIPISLYEAAELDGSGPWLTFRGITLPALRKFIGLALLLRFIDAYKIIDTLFIMTHGGPATTSELPAFFIYVKAFEHLEMGRAAALTWVVTLGAIIFSKFFVSKVMKKS